MNKLYNDTAVQAIANAIRAKNGSSDTYTIAEMSTALNNLSYYAKPIISNVPLATFEADGLPLNSLKVSVEAKQAGSGTPSPENVRPISGWSEVNVSDVGKNLLDEPSFKDLSKWKSDLFPYGGYPTDNVNKGFLLNTIPNKTYSISFGFTADTTPKHTYLYLCRAKGNNSERIEYLTSVDYHTNHVTFTTEKGYIYYLRVNVINASSFVPNMTFAQLELGSTATSYEPYINQTTTISLPQTVYGAEVDVVNGILKITDGYIASYNGETLPSTWISSMDEYAEGTSPTTGAEVCYELATPTTVTLTPTLIKSLNGQNNLSVDSGDVIELEYFKEV